MIKVVIEVMLAAIFLVFMVSQLIIPAFSSKLNFFWIFDKDSREDETSGVGTLKELAKETKIVSKQVKETKSKINSAEKQLKDIKSQI
jgi:5-bromo-4-chloroindolyl phosphate hydrolysis protein